MMAPSSCFMARDKSCKKTMPFFARGRVLGRHVQVGGHADAVGQFEPGLVGRRFERGPFRVAHAGDFGSVDFENVEAALLRFRQELSGSSLHICVQ